VLLFVLLLLLRGVQRLELGPGRSARLTVSKLTVGKLTVGRTRLARGEVTVGRCVGEGNSGARRLLLLL
jgi:hypothetical protein